MIRMFRLVTLALVSCLLQTGLWGIRISDHNLVEINSIALRLKLIGEQRVSDFSYSPITFIPQLSSFADSLVICYSATEMQVNMCVKPLPDLDMKAWQVTATATSFQDINLRQLYFQHDYQSLADLQILKGAAAIAEQNPLKNRNVSPFSDKVMQYRSSTGSFWIVASNYLGCQEVERLGGDTVNLYDHALHFYRRYRPSTSASDLPKDTMPMPAGSSRSWSFLIFGEEPVLLKLNRWPAGKKAALCITNDADAENHNRLSAVYLGSSNPDSPKYLSSGLIANGIKISNTVFGFNQPRLQGIWNTIHEHGNSIGYHTFAAAADPPGTNEQALLHDLVPYNIRLWIDHNVPQNPEDLAWNGLDPSSENYVGDIINQSAIQYAWFADTPPTNPFNAYDDPWRLPHLIYEATSLTKPVWFFGRTRTEVWEYTNGSTMIDMKHVLTAENIDKLIADEGLHISYTHFSAAWDGVVPFFEITPEGDYQIKDEVEDMLRMLAYYRDYRGLWIDTAENIFDRMLAIEQVSVTAVTATANQGEFRLTLKNNSDYDLVDFSFSYRETDYILNLLPAQGSYEFTVLHQKPDYILASPADYFLGYSSGMIKVENKSESIPAQTTIKIYNLRGQLLATHIPDRSSHVSHIPFGNRASGVCFARITVNGVLQATRKLVVVK